MPAAPLHLVQLVTRRQLRGAEVFAGQLAERLVAAGCRVTLIGLHGPRDGAPAPAGCRVHDLPGEAGRGVDPRRALALRRLLRRVAAEAPVDLVQANGSATLKYSVLARLGVGARPPLVYRGISIASHWLRGRLHRRWNRWLFGRVDHVAAVSRRAAEDLLATYGLPPSRVSVIPIGTPVPATWDRAAARRRLLEISGAPADAELLAHVGSFSPEKNHRLLLDAFALVAARRPAARLVMIGDGPLRPAVERRAREAGLTGRVVSLGARRDAPDLAGGADLLLLSSDVEGIPGVVLEAAAREVPTVATAVGSLDEVVADGHTGLLVPAGDAAALAAAVERLLAAPGERAAMGDAARRRIAAELDLDRVAERFLDLYRRLCRSDAAADDEGRPSPGRRQ